jgi:hypothetical protein
MPRTGTLIRFTTEVRRGAVPLPWVAALRAQTDVDSPPS